MLITYLAAEVVETRVQLFPKSGTLTGTHIIRESGLSL
jgi:hypothetical protein